MVLDLAGALTVKCTEKPVAIFQALAQPVRLRILQILSRGPACVCELTQATGKRQPYISQQLKILSQVGLVFFERQGRNRCYHLNRNLLRAAMEILHGLCQKNNNLNKGEMNDVQSSK